MNRELKEWHISGMMGLNTILTSRRNAMSSNSTLLVQQLRADFEKLLALVTGPEAQRATLDQMERSLFRQVLRLGLRLLKLFLTTRVEAESHAPQPGTG